MSESVIPADDETRRQNYLAIQRRDKWRAKYKMLASFIAEAKALTNENPSDKEYKYFLRTLQKEARDLMEERSYITTALKRTAYKWI